MGSVPRICGGFALVAASRVPRAPLALTPGVVPGRASNRVILAHA